MWLLTEEYEAYMKEQEAFVVEQEPRAADVPPVFISTEDRTGQVDQQQRPTFMLLLLITTHTLGPCGR